MKTPTNQTEPICNVQIDSVEVNINITDSSFKNLTEELKKAINRSNIKAY